jgi:uncharacterized ion transporter superfamily protein YfcC
MAKLTLPKKKNAQATNETEEASQPELTETKRLKKKEKEGSKWTAVVLLVITVFFGLVFMVWGSIGGGDGWYMPRLTDWIPGGSGGTTFIIE